MKIPIQLREQIVAKSASLTQEEIAEWLKSEHGVDVSRQAVAKVLAAERANARETSQVKFDAFGEAEAPHTLEDLRVRYAHEKRFEARLREAAESDPTSKSIRSWVMVHQILTRDAELILKISGGLSTPVADSLGDLLHEVARKRAGQ